MDVFLRFSPCSGWVGDWRLGDWRLEGRLGDGRLGGSVAGKYCSGGGFGLGGLVRKGREEYRRGACEYDFIKDWFNSAN